MNCKHARGLFSARIDGELSPAEASALELHLRECRDGCPENWTEFETTVRMVHALPPVECDPSFVGQVLDRVRAWEAQEAGRTVRLPMRGPDLGERLREWVAVLTGSRVLAPVRVVGAVALGVAGAIALGQFGVLPSQPRSSSGTAERMTAAAPGTPGGPTLSVSGSVRPFSDLAGDIPSVRASRGGEDSIWVQPDDAGNGSTVYPGGIGNRQVLAPGDAQPRVTTTDGHPQIIL